jgi:hypothetical protein
MFSESIVNCTILATFMLACEVAVTVKVAGSVLLTLASVGTVFGATYMPLADIVPQTETGSVLHVSCQVTAVFEVPVTAAANCTVWKVSMLETSVVIDTVIGALPPPPPQDDIVAAAATARMLSRHARFIMESSLH